MCVCVCVRVCVYVYVFVCVCYLIAAMYIYTHGCIPPHIVAQITIVSKTKEQRKPSDEQDLFQEKSPAPDLVSPMCLRDKKNIS